MSDRAHAAWTEIREDGVPELVLETDHGEQVYELSPQAAGELRREFVDGPTVRHDKPGKE